MSGSLSAEFISLSLVANLVPEEVYKSFIFNRL